MSVFIRAPRRNTEAPRISIVVPALNEAANLAKVLPDLPDVHEVILVDGGSVDGTIATARRLRPDIITVLQSRTGKGNALAAGFARVTGDIVVTFDADGSANPAELSRFVQVLKDGADFAKGSRFVFGGGSSDITPFRTAGNRALTALFNFAFGTRYTDLCYGYNAFWADLLPVLALPDHTKPMTSGSRLQWGDGFEIETVITCRLATADVDIVEVPSLEMVRTTGDSPLSAVADGLRVLRTLISEWRRARAVRAALRPSHRRRGELADAIDRVVPGKIAA